MHLKSFALTLSAIIGLAGLGTAAAGPITVTTGAGYIKMVDALTADYQKSTGRVVQKSFGGNIGQMLAQVKHGDGVNVVISDEATLKRFNDLLAPETGILGDTPLVLIWRKGLTLKTPADLSGDAVKSVASPNPKAAIYGRSADAWLKASGLDKTVGPKLQVVGTVPQVFSYVATGNMDAGFVNVSAAKSGRDKLGGVMEITDDSAIVRMIVRPVKGAENDPDVKAFMDYLTSKEAKPLLQKFGVR